MRALVTSGGGAKGAFSVGALKILYQNNLGDFDVISGTSTGSLIAALAAVNQYDVLENEYKNVNDVDILAQPNLVQNILLNKPYFYSTLPLEAKVNQYVTDAVFNQIKASNKYVCFTAISLQSGRRTVFTTRMFQPAGDYDVVLIEDGPMLRDAIMASTNQAAFLPPVKIRVGQSEQQFVDGGNRDVLPVKPAIDLGATEIFALSNNPLALNKVGGEYTDVMQILLRAISVFIQDIRDNDYADLDRYTGGSVYKIQPSRELDQNNPTGLNFKKSDMLLWMRYGEIITREVLKNNNLINTGPLLAGNP